MSKPESEKTSSQLTSLDDEVIRRFRGAIASGRHWYLGLLEAVGQWSSAEETYQGRHYQYLIDGSALDWQLLAERLCEAVDSLLPEKEKSDFLLRGKPPLDITKEQFQELLGSAKYRQYLNYFYGITVEEALLLSVKEEVRKERRLAGLTKEEDTTAEAFLRIYGETQPVLLEQFRRVKHYRLLRSISLSELKEFTYWLFQYRIKHNDKSRVASDTRKALDWLNRKGYPEKLIITRPLTGTNQTL
ncbi:MAG: hypothetical protein PHY28_00285 [Dehalococcoidales bacterium]|nr:hypothetical protein [Dehalococcoidales bacterium]